MRNFLLILLVLFSTIVMGQTSSSQNGNWNAGASWDGGMLPPDNGDTVFIEAGHNISINSNTTYTTPLVIIVRGVLTLNQTLTLPSTSQIVIEPGGMVDSGNNGWRLEIGATSWKDFKKDPITSGILTDVTLSIRSVRLEAQQVGQSDVSLQWSVEGDKEVFSVFVQKSTNGKDFETIQEIETHSTTGTVMIGNGADAYSVYYRLKVTQKGKTVYSSSIQLLNEQFELKFYPNPFADRIHLNAEMTSDDVEVKIFDILGNQVFQSAELTDVIDMSSLERGIYFVDVLQGGHPVQHVRLVKK